MFRANKFFHYIVEKPRRESIWYDIFSKNNCTESFEKFERMMIIITESNWWSDATAPKKRSRVDRPSNNGTHDFFDATGSIFPPELGN